jgi:UDP-N-acetyl-D-mannosaminuronic acid transferase (WecB/TagA/CpsF family)
MSALQWNSKTVLGIPFFQGTAEEAVRAMRHGGLLVAPAAPALMELETHREYREALLHADIALADSSFMVLVWNHLQHDSMSRLSGLAYLKALLQEPEMRHPSCCVWVMADYKSAAQNVRWLALQGIFVPISRIYIAPRYAKPGADETLLRLIESVRPRHVVITLGGGTQEWLGYYLKSQLSYPASIHCIGAAIAFLSGAQVRIPDWADHLGLGWLFRSISQPGLYVPRYWGARRLLGLIRRYRDKLPAQPSLEPQS